MMAYPGVALIAMVGIGLGFALWYFLADDSPHAQSPHSSDVPPPRSPPPSENSWDAPKNSSRWRPKSNKKETYDCIFCTEPLKGVTTTETKCGHIFHSKCIEKWRNEVDPARCPFCRQLI